VAVGWPQWWGTWGTAVSRSLLPFLFARNIGSVVGFPGSQTHFGRRTIWYSKTLLVNAVMWNAMMLQITQHAHGSLNQCSLAYSFLTARMVCLFLPFSCSVYRKRLLYFQPTSIYIFRSLWVKFLWYPQNQNSYVYVVENFAVLSLLQVLVKDERSTKSCRSILDPHQHTFDKLWVKSAKRDCLFCWSWRTPPCTIAV